VSAIEPGGAPAQPPADGAELVYTLGSSRRVRLREAEAELQGLWETASREAEQAGHEGVVRVREINLVVYAAGDAVAERVSQVILRLAERHPARAIVLLDVGLPAPGEGVTDSWVSAACYLTAQGERQVCWEQVTIPAYGKAVQLLDTAAMPVLVPHLPTVLWWPGQPDFEGEAFRRLGDVTDLLVVDSAGFSHPVEGLGRLATVVRDESRGYHVNDLNWARLTTWREMMAGVFDDASRLDWVPRIRRLKVVFGAEDTFERPDRSTPPAASRALLFVGWFASRLGWGPSTSEWWMEGSSMRTVLHRLQDDQRDGATGPDGPSGDRYSVEVVLQSEALPRDASGGLVAVEVEIGGALGDDGSFVLSIGRVGTSCICETRVKGPADGQITHTADASAVPEDRLLADELDYLGPDHVFEDSLLIAAALAALPGSSAIGRET